MPVIDEAVALLDVTVCQPERCPDECDDQEEAVFVAVSASTDPASTGQACYLYTNVLGGDLDEWSNPITLSNWGQTVGENADAVLCIGEFVVIASTTAGEIIYSDDLGTTQVVVTNTDWITNGPKDIDGIDQSFLVMVHENGHIYTSVDAGRTWSLSDDAQACSALHDYERVMIARDNAEVIYAVGCANTTDSTGSMTKSTNGSENWFALTDPRTAETSFCYTALCVLNQSDVIVGCSDGEIWETEDGGVTWSQQLEPVGFPDLGPSVNDIVNCGCGVLWMAVSGTTASESVIYRNVDGGASGKWFIPSEADSLTQPPLAIACASVNLAVAVGGVPASTSGMVVLLA